MTVNGIFDVERVPLAIDYRRMYRGQVVVSISDRELAPAGIEFVLEMSPLGAHEVSVQFLGTTDFPLVPVLRQLKDRISEMDRAGQLP